MRSLWAVALLAGLAPPTALALLLGGDARRFSDRSSHVPDSQVFRTVFDRLHADTELFQEPSPSKFKIVVGIMDMAGDEHPMKDDFPWSAREHLQRRQAHRNTWMQLRSVCRAEYEAPTRPECSLFPVFVLGNKSMGNEVWCTQLYAKHTNYFGRPHPNNCSQRYYTRLEDARSATGAFSTQRLEQDSYHDMIFLHGEPENRDLGKTWTWFEFAIRAYPWATHIAKMDMDAYPFPHRILSAMPTRLANPYGPCKSEDPNVSARYQYFGDLFRKKKRPMHGGAFVILSYQLARLLTKADGIWRTKKFGIKIEDAELGSVVGHHLRSTCVDFGPPIRNAWLHFGHCGPNGEDFPNHCSSDSKNSKKMIQTMNYTIIKQNLRPDVNASYQF